MVRGVRSELFVLAWGFAARVVPPASLFGGSLVCAPFGLRFGPLPLIGKAAELHMLQEHGNNYRAHESRAPEMAAMCRVGAFVGGSRRHADARSGIGTGAMCTPPTHKHNMCILSVLHRLRASDLSTTCASVRRQTHILLCEGVISVVLPRRGEWQPLLGAPLDHVPLPPQRDASRRLSCPIIHGWATFRLLRQRLPDCTHEALLRSQVFCFGDSRRDL